MSPPEAGKPRGYAFACLGCKRKKAKCDGGQPSCGRCQIRSETCIYQQDSSTRIAELSQGLSQAKAFVSFLLTAPYDQKLSALQRFQSSPPSWFNNFDEHSELEGPSLGNDSPVNVYPPPISSDLDTNSSTPKEATVRQLLHHMSLTDDENKSGSLEHFGSLSLRYKPPPPAIVSYHAALEQNGKSYVQQEWSPPEETQRMDWKNLARATYTLDQPERVDTVFDLLERYFAWFNPELLIVSPAVFYRDLGIGATSYYSEFLLHCICAYTERFSDTKSSSSSLVPSFLDLAKLHIAQVFDESPNLPSIQGFMILAMRECECGNTTQGFIYSGIAWRLMRDLGLHLVGKDGDIFGALGLPQEDKELRSRLFWSAYIIDKVVSLGLGRSPTFNAYQKARPSKPADLSEDRELWRPYGDNHAASEQAFTISCFIALSDLMTVLTTVMMNFYVQRPDFKLELNFVEETSSQLSSLSSSWSSTFFYRNPSSRDTCPPPHILTLNLLYRSTLILIYRPYLQSPFQPENCPSDSEISIKAQNVCTKMALEIDSFLKLHHKTYGFANMTYAQLYCCYVAATVNLMNFQCADEVVSRTAAPCLSLSLRVLENASSNSPALRRSLGILRERLVRPPSVLKRRPIPNEDFRQNTRESSSKKRASKQEYISSTSDRKQPDETNPESARTGLEFSTSTTLQGVETPVLSQPSLAQEGSVSFPVDNLETSFSSLEYDIPDFEGWLHDMHIQNGDVFGEGVMLQRDGDYMSLNWFFP